MMQKQRRKVMTAEQVMEEEQKLMLAEDHAAYDLRQFNNMQEK